MYLQFCSAGESTRLISLIFYADAISLLINATKTVGCTEPFEQIARTDFRVRTEHLGRREGAEWIFDDRSKHLLGIIGMRRGEVAGEAREIPTLFKYAAAAPAVGSRSFSFKHQREFAQNATRFPSFFGRVPLALCDAE